MCNQLLSSVQGEIVSNKSMSSRSHVSPSGFCYLYGHTSCAGKTWIVHFHILSWWFIQTEKVIRGPAVWQSCASQNAQVVPNTCHSLCSDVCFCYASNGLALPECQDFRPGCMWKRTLSPRLIPICAPSEGKPDRNPEQGAWERRPRPTFEPFEMPQVASFQVLTVVCEALQGFFPKALAPMPLLAHSQHLPFCRPSPPKVFLLHGNRLHPHRSLYERSLVGDIFLASHPSH